MWFDAFSSPVGKLVVAADDAGIRHILFDENRYDVPGRDAWRRDPIPVREAREQLLAYFAGDRREFDLLLNPVGTPFQVTVWDMLAQIPFGETWSYRDVALRIAMPTAVRAVGAANGRNPLPIVLPCHRVIGADGRLVGFGGGLPTKQFLLEHEGALPRQAGLL
ncbi:MAG: methylated-DNA--[protein]-cysteine S-methyltransferase [Tahibacter sp.]